MHSCHQFILNSPEYTLILYGKYFKLNFCHCKQNELNEKQCSIMIAAKNNNYNNVYGVCVHKKRAFHTNKLNNRNCITSFAQLLPVFHALNLVKVNYAH